MSVIENFKQISKIPHCSHDTAQLREFLREFCMDTGASVNVDKWGNIHAIKGSAKICLQSHYDMVCIGEAPKICMYEEDGFLMAKNSSLGADNGMGVAMMMDALKRYENIECLFTNDEEVGLIGANNFNSKLVSKYLLNLDSECDDEVIIGCAAGVDICVNFSNDTQKTSPKNAYLVEILDLVGGHSGVQIHQNLPNAIKILAKFLAQNDCEIVKIWGGERSNSIPANARAVVLCKKELRSNDFKITSLGVKDEILKDSDKILNFINSFHQGVRKYDTSLNIVLDSINLSLVNHEQDEIKTIMFARSMSDEGLDEICFEVQSLARALGCKIGFSDRSIAWKPEISEFAKSVCDELRLYKSNAKITAVHAGLECGILKNCGENMQVCSIGPNIYAPHSASEKVKIKSVHMIANVVDKIVKKYQ